MRNGELYRLYNSPFLILLSIVSSSICRALLVIAFVESYSNFYFMYNLTGLMVIFTLYFDIENVQKSSSEQYTENNTMMHKERMVYSFLIGHHKGKGICLESRYGQHMASTGNRTPDLLILSPTPSLRGHMLHQVLKLI